jgi:hypothetical protein
MSSKFLIRIALTKVSIEPGISAVTTKPSMKSLYVAVRLLTSIAVTIAARKNLIIDTDLFSDVE